MPNLSYFVIADFTKLNAAMNNNSALPNSTKQNYTMLMKWDTLRDIFTNQLCPILIKTFELSHYSEHI